MLILIAVSPASLFMRLSLFKEGSFPIEWTKAIIVPLHKKGDPNDIDNYRGILLLSVLGKVFTFIFVTESICTLCLCCCMYSVCRSVGVLSCVYVIQSFTYVLRVVI